MPADPNTQLFLMQQKVISLQDELALAKAANQQLREELDATRDQLGDTIEALRAKLAQLEAEWSPRAG